MPLKGVQAVFKYTPGSLKITLILEKVSYIGILSGGMIVSD
jgi:hypothetical protein